MHNVLFFAAGRECSCLSPEKITRRGLLWTLAYLAENDFRRHIDCENLRPGPGRFESLPFYKQFHV